jgi:hypothetical protein
VSKFGKVLFSLNTNYAAELCLQVVGHCNCASHTRHEATAFLYLLMKVWNCSSFEIAWQKNYEEAKKNFTRVKVQTTIAISKLVGKGIKVKQT